MAVCLIGLIGGELDGLLVGLMLGWAMSLFSAQDLISGVVLKGMAGFVAGLAGRQMVYLSPIILVMGLLVASCVAGLVTSFGHKTQCATRLVVGCLDGSAAASLSRCGDWRRGLLAYVEVV